MKTTIQFEGLNQVQVSTIAALASYIAGDEEGLSFNDLYIGLIAILQHLDEDAESLELNLAILELGLSCHSLYKTLRTSPRVAVFVEQEKLELGILKDKDPEAE